VTIRTDRQTYVGTTYIATSRQVLATVVEEEEEEEALA
jgi:hypothetical protein